MLSFAGDWQDLCRQNGPGGDAWGGKERHLRYGAGTNSHGLTSWPVPDTSSWPYVVEMEVYKQLHMYVEPFSNHHSSSQ